MKKTITRHDTTNRHEKPKVPLSILMNINRQKILQFLFKFPCTHLHGIARNFELSINATRWHLQKLMQVGYIDGIKLRNRKVFFPYNSLKKTDIQILSLLNDKKMESLFVEIQQTPGITQKELYKLLNKKQSTIVNNLETIEHNELIYSQKDGLYRRYYPTTVLLDREKMNRKTMRDYRRFLMQILERDGMEPEILRTTDKKIHIRIKSGKNKSDLIFYFNPYQRFMR